MKNNFIKLVFLSMCLLVFLSSPAFSHPTFSGTAWVWDTYPMFWVYAGQEKIFIVNIVANYVYLKMSISGLTMNTLGTFNWVFPDGRVTPQPGKVQGIIDIVGMSGQGLLVLRAGTNIPDNPIPKGYHALRIKANVSVDCYFKVSIEAY